MKQLMKSAVFTDIHFGKKGNSNLHNQDCIDFVKWFCKQVKKDPTIDHIKFLGDWYENRSAINISTMGYSYRAMKMLNELNLPFFFIIGNHDLYFRNSRDIHSVIHHSQFNNVKVIDEPVVINEIGNGGSLMCPYLFHEEYPKLVKHLNLETWFGHFEFKGFVVTGYNITMPTGPCATDFRGPNHIFSGHFHKRQAPRDSNIVYIGNCFPMDFGDAGDFARGMMTYNHTNDEILFYDWKDCPKYIKTKLSDILDDNIREQILVPKSRVNCLVDIKIDFDESSVLRKSFTKKYKLRELVLEESPTIHGALSETEINIDWDNEELQGVNDLVMLMLKEINNEHIDNNLLIKLYQDLKIVE